MIEVRFTGWPTTVKATRIQVVLALSHPVVDDLIYKGQEAVEQMAPVFKAVPGRPDTMWMEAGAAAGTWVWTQGQMLLFPVVPVPECVADELRPLAIKASALRHKWIDEGITCGLC